MPEIDRTQIAIETTIDNSQAEKKIDDLNRDLDKLEQPRKVDIDVSDIIKKLNDELTSVNRQMADLFRGKGSINNLKGMTPLVERKNSLQSAIGQLKSKDLTPDKLESILSGVGYKLNNDTIERINQGSNDNRSFEDIKDAALEMQKTVQEYNQLIRSTRSKQKPLSPEDLEKTNAKIEELKAALLKMGLTEKSFNQNGYASYKSAWEEQEQKKQQEESKGQGKSDVSKIVGAVLGIRSIFAMIRRIVSQNERLSAAINNFFTTVRNILAPILNFLGAFINTIAGWLGKIFGVSSETATNTGNTARTLMGFDEINRLDAPNSGGGAATKQPGKLQWLEDLLNGLLETIKGIIKLVAGLIRAAFMSIVVIVETVIAAIATLIGGAVRTV